MPHNAAEFKIPKLLGMQYTPQRPVPFIGRLCFPDYALALILFLSSGNRIMCADAPWQRKGNPAWKRSQVRYIPKHNFAICEQHFDSSHA
jgi:hypothetical protein